MQELETVDMRTHPFDNVLGVADASKIPPHRKLKDDYAVVVVKGTDAKQFSDNLSRG